MVVMGALVIEHVLSFRSIFTIKYKVSKHLNTCYFRSSMVLMRSSMRT